MSDGPPYWEHWKPELRKAIAATLAGYDRIGLAQIGRMPGPMDEKMADRILDTLRQRQIISGYTTEQRPVGECAACGHRMLLAVWHPERQGGICEACRDLAEPHRGGCSAERGCYCDLDRDRYLALADVAIERVVEGLAATIKAQLRFSPMARTDEAVMRGDPDNGDYILRAKVLEALEAAREDTTDG